MGHMLDPQTSKLVNAIDEYMENPPKDMPEELSGQLTDLGKGLRGYGDDPGELSPGQREAAEKSPGGIGSYKEVALAKSREEEKSPGQRELEQAMATMQEAIGSTADN